MIYEFSTSQATLWQRLIQPFYRRWLGLASSAEASILYRSTEHFGLNFKHLADNLHQLQIVKWHLMKYSKDPQARKLYAYRLQREREGHTGKGRKFFPCLKEV